MNINIKDIAGFCELIKSLNNEKDIIEKFLDYGIKVLECDGGTFFTLNERKRMMSFDIVKGKNSEELSGVSFPYTGIVGWVAEMKKDILVKDTSNNPLFTKKVDYATGYSTKSVIAVMLSYGKDIFGITEFINPVKKEHFDEDDFDLIKLLSVLVSLSLYIRRIESTIVEINNRFSSTINNLSGGFIGIDNNGIIIFFNPRAREIFGIDKDFLGKDYKELPDIMYQIKKILSESKNGKLVKRAEFICKIGSMDKKIGYSTITLKGVDSSIIGSAVIFQDIT